ncbi:hypothetical protein, partial [Bacillus tropicus]|uniref:hypothetical protein n=1 Tax=Bacillus tropicus TaxID=2026188 RepID=UPI001A7E77B6
MHRWIHDRILWYVGYSENQNLTDTLKATLMKKDKTLQKAIDLGGSARILAYSSRSTLFCFFI